MRIEVKSIPIINISDLDSIQKEINFFCKGRKVLNVQVFQDFKITSDLTTYPSRYIAVVILEKQTR